MARPRHQPDDAQRRQVETLAGYGIPEAEIAGLIGIDAKTLRKHYRNELDHGHTKANARVAENLFRKATGDGRESVIAAIFWMKTRAQWKETQVTEMAGVQPKITITWKPPTEKPQPDELTGAAPRGGGLKVIDGDLALPASVETSRRKAGA